MLACRVYYQPPIPKNYPPTSLVTSQRKQLYQKPLNFIPEKILKIYIFTQLLTNYCKEFKENSKFFSIVRKAEPYHTVTVQWCICSIFFINQVFGLLTIIKPLRKAISNSNCNHEILLQLPSGWVTNFHNGRLSQFVRNHWSDSHNEHTNQEQGELEVHMWLRCNTWSLVMQRWGCMLMSYW